MESAALGQEAEAHLRFLERDEVCILHLRLSNRRHSLDRPHPWCNTCGVTPREAVAPIVERIKDLDISRVVVFGSTVTGAFDKDSDLDLAVIVPDPEPGEKFNRVDRAIELRRHIRDINAEIAIDILVYTESEFSRLRNSPSFVRAEIAEAGETVYERAG